MENNGKFENFCRMSAEDFEFLLNLIGADITKQTTYLRKPVPAKERLAVTLRFLASGDSYKSLSYLFRISPQLISCIVDEVCQTLKKKLCTEIKTPVTSSDWKKIAHDFEIKWNFPHCVGSLDGKHVVIQAPIHSGSEYYNYKGTFSIVLMVLSDADYCVTYSNVGCQGRISDGGIFQHTSLCKKLEDNTLFLPEPEPLPMKEKCIPYVIVGDNAFPLKENIMVPFNGCYESKSLERIFNYRLSRARRIVENVFGIMSAIFRVLRKPIILKPERATLVTECCVLLHNFLRRSKSSRDMYTPSGTFDTENNGEIIDGLWRKDLEGTTSLLPLNRRGRRPCDNAKVVRQEFAEYFATNGKVEWQDKMT